MASFSKNADSVLGCGYQVWDAIASWVKVGFAAAPFLEKEQGKINGIMTREKPDGAVRICNS
jgi:hypothetical protein